MGDPIQTFLLKELGSGDLRHALSTAGAVRLAGTADPECGALFAQWSREAFGLPSGIRERYRRVGIMSGYTPPGIEGVRGQQGDPSREFWDMLAPRLHSTNFPKEVWWLSPHGLLWYNIFERTATRLLELIDPRLPEIIRDGRHSLRVNHYHPSPAGEIVFPRHIDFGMFTLYLGGAESGLQFRHDEKWHDLDNPPGCIVAGVGSTLRQYEPDFKALCHRVVASGQDRISITFFTEPRPDVVLPNGVTAQAHLERLVGLIRKD